MSVLGVLGKTAGVLGRGFEGYAADEQTQVKNALAAQNAQREAERNRVLNLMTMREVNTPRLGDTEYAAAKAQEEDAVANARVPAAIRQAEGLAPIQQATHLANREADVAHPEIHPAAISVQAGVNGQPAQGVVTGGTDPAHPLGSTIPLTTVGKTAPGQGPGSAPMAAKVGQFGEMLKKYQDLIGSMEGLDVGLSQSAARDIAEHGIGIGSARIPGTKGLGSMLVNKTPQYAQYQAALSPFILAAAHALSGARINQDQVAQIRQSIELQPGDFTNPTVRAQKEKNLVDLINSIGGSLPEEAIVAQEDQMDPKAIDALVARGYKRRRTTAAPKAGPTSGFDVDAYINSFPIKKKPTP